ncbi:hypothetical protein ISR92_03280 [Patescibacteria group bacterium]|nr:hypothetical protein [Patescibacteria group bacterium]
MLKRSIYLIFIVVIVLAWSYFIYSFGAENLVEVIGVTNGYMLAFLITLFGGSSTITSMAYVTTILTLTLGGLDPIKLALIGGTGLFIGDTLYYYIGVRGQYVFSESKFIIKIAGYINKLPDWAAFVIMYLYFASPSPNDVMVVLLGLSKFSFRKILIPLILGDITFILAISYFMQLSSRL